MSSHRIATYSVDGSTRYGVVAEGGLVDLSARFGKDYPTLREAIAAGALTKLAEDGARHSPDHALDAITWLPPIPSPEKIICIGVNYPDRNAEYKDARMRRNIPACSRARRARSLDTIRRWFARAHPRSSTMRAKWCSSSARPGGTSRKARRWITSPPSHCAMKAPSGTGSGMRSSM